MNNDKVNETKVLVVDDKPENLIAMEAILQDVDVSIVTAQSGMKP